MTTEINAFASWLKETLHKKRMSGGEFAQKSKLSKAAVYFYLDGSRVPDEQALARIVAALGVSLDSIPPLERKPIGRPRRATSSDHSQSHPPLNDLVS